MQDVWSEIKRNAVAMSQREPVLEKFCQDAVLIHEHLYQALVFQLASHLSTPFVGFENLRELMAGIYARNPRLEEDAILDLLAYFERDPACDTHLRPLIHFKGFWAIQCHRVAAHLWQSKRKSLAYFLQSRSSAVFDVDIHPAARLGGGIMFDHATGIVIGESAEVGDNVSMLHGVSLGGSGVAQGKRHPSIEDGALISVGAKLLGNIQIGKGVKIGGGSVVLGSVPDYSTVVGVPAKVIGRSDFAMPAFSMDQYIPAPNGDA